MNLQTVLTEVDSWPVGDRIRLINELRERLLEQGYEPELDEELKAELERRMEELDRNPDAGVAWEVVKERMLGRFPR
jgi:putative addiction module component (TIGR02574 family)